MIERRKLLAAIGDSGTNEGRGAPVTGWRNSGVS
ncbi:hypothetical protein BXY53_0860 [Dichotomicrobium thermohalophilum]|uniref:Uncharacterized protein n=1 Tax=Dichotomicrobium thermohalophilum TaxID=933063 RepID=A0A397Q3T5_9HYPH|nr:hypothetical protein BXY53_0860 [Dichotomicrobium thermohalophilum]